MTTLIVKITDGTDIRRFTANVADLTFESVQKRTAEAFGLGVKDLKLQYKDDEGDMVTMSSNDEMLEAIGLATSMVPAVLRLNVSKTTNTPKTTNTTTNTGGGAPPHDMNDLMQKISAQLPHLVHQLPEALRHLVPNAELDLAATVAANVNSAMTGGCHPGVTCDKTGMHPIVGNRWHLKGHDYDLCEAEYQKLAEEEKLKYELIPPPCAPPLAAGFGMGGCAGMGGMGGGRPTPADHGAVDEGGIHPGVSCDKSGMNPIVGFRSHLRGHNYDLCDAEYQKLPPKEQAWKEEMLSFFESLSTNSAMAAASMATQMRSSRSKDKRVGALMMDVVKLVGQLKAMKQKEEAQREEATKLRAEEKSANEQVLADAKGAQEAVLSTTGFQ